MRPRPLSHLCLPSPRESLHGQRPSVSRGPGTAQAASDVRGSMFCDLTTTKTPGRQQPWAGVQALTAPRGSQAAWNHVPEPCAAQSLRRDTNTNCTATNTRFNSHPHPTHRRLPNSSGDLNQMSIA